MTLKPLITHIDAATLPSSPAWACGADLATPDHSLEDDIGYESCHPLTWLPIGEPDALSA